VRTGGEDRSPRTRGGRPNHEIDPTAAVDAFALALLTSCGQLSLIMSHMHRFAAEHDPADDAEAVPATLHKLLRDVLTPLAGEHAIEDVAVAVQMVELATQQIGDELFVVDLSRLEDD
jgi:hypothetical protein